MNEEGFGGFAQLLAEASDVLAGYAVKGVDISLRHFAGGVVHLHHGGELVLSPGPVDEVVEPDEERLVAGQVERVDAVFADLAVEEVEEVEVVIEVVIEEDMENMLLNLKLLNNSYNKTVC